MYYFALNKYLTARKMTQGGNKEELSLSCLGLLEQVLFLKYIILLEIWNK